MNEFHESVDMNKLYFEYKGSTRDVNIYEYYDSKELFSKIENNQLIKVVDNLEKFYNSREEDITFFRDYAKMMLDAGYKSEKDEIKQGETTRAGLKILTPKQMLQ